MSVQIDDFEDRNTLDDDYTCAYPGKCLMPSMVHTRGECHTVEDMEAYYAEMEGLPTDVPEREGKK